MTHHNPKPPAPRAAGASQSSMRHGFAAAAPTGIAAARSSTTLALSMMVALRYLEGRSRRPASGTTDALPVPAAS